MKIQNKHDLPGPPERILILQLGDIGDVVWTWPSIYALKTKFPAAKITLLARRGRSGLLEGNPFLDEIMEVVQSQENILKSLTAQVGFFSKLREKHFDWAIDLRGDERGAFLAKISGARARYGVFYQSSPLWRNFMYTHIAAACIPRNLPSRGPAEQCLGVLRPIGIDIDGELPVFPIPDMILKRAEDIFKKVHIDPAGRFITISPYSRWKYKEWDQKKWSAMITWLWRCHQISSVIVGGPEDRKNADELKGLCGDFVFNLAGETTLAEWAGVISRSILHVGIDTGGPHMAAALGLPTVTIYGPSFADGWAQAGPKHKFVFPDRDCVPCHQTGCENSHRSECLEELPESNVRHVVEKTLAEINGGGKYGC